MLTVKSPILGIAGQLEEIPFKRPADSGRGVGKESEYMGCGGVPGDARFIGPCNPSGVRGIFGRALNAIIDSVTLYIKQSTILLSRVLVYYIAGHLPITAISTNSVRATDNVKTSLQSSNIKSNRNQPGLTSVVSVVFFSYSHYVCT